MNVLPNVACSPASQATRLPVPCSPAWQATRSIDARCRPIRLLLTDVDGVLTDGRIILDNEGRETKQFCVRDGLGAKLWAAAGHRLGIVTARSSHVVERRAAEMGVDLVRQGVESKLPAAREIIASLNLTPEEVAYLGDDLPDLPVVMHVGLGVAVADACQPLLDAADHTTTAPGGGGALRELVETLLHHQGRLKDLVEEYRRS